MLVVTIYLQCPGNQPLMDTNLQETLMRTHNMPICGTNLPKCKVLIDYSATSFLGNVYLIPGLIVTISGLKVTLAGG